MGNYYSMPMMLFQAHICRIHILHSARYMYIDMDHMIVYIYIAPVY